MSHKTTSAICYGPGFDTMDTNPWRPRWYGRTRTKLKFESAVRDCNVFDGITFFDKDIFDSGVYQHSLLCMRLWVHDDFTTIKRFKQIEIDPECAKRLKASDIQDLVEEAAGVVEQELKELEG